jgi:hypothetical protein
MVRTPLFSVILLYISQHCLLWSKNVPLSHWFSLEIRTKKEELRSTILFNIQAIGAMTRTSGQPQVKLSLLRSNALKIRPQGAHRVATAAFWRTFHHDEKITHNSMLSRVALLTPFP